MRRFLSNYFDLLLIVISSDMNNSPLTCFVALTTLSHYRASVRTTVRVFALPCECVIVYAVDVMKDILLCVGCHLKFHKHHFDNGEEFVGPCKG